MPCVQITGGEFFWDRMAIWVKFQICFFPVSPCLPPLAVLYF